MRKISKQSAARAQSRRPMEAEPGIIEFPGGGDEKVKARLTGHIDEPFTILVLLLVAVGLICLFSASYAEAFYSQGGNGTYYVVRQGLFAAAGIAAMFLASRINYHKLHYFAVLLLIVSILLMASVKLAPSLWVTRNGATRWMALFGIQFQPSEVAKFALILFFSSSITLKGTKRMGNFRQGILPYLGVMGIFIILLYWQKHLSGMIITVGLGIIIIFIGGAHMGWLAGMGAAGAAGVIGYILINEYAIKRILVWFDPFIDPRGDGWQGSQSLIAIGSGGFWGLGLGQSRQKHMYLPEPANDFIFSVICEELGLAGAVLILIVFAALIMRGYYIAARAGDRFGTLLAAGITTQVAIQTIVNVGVVSGLLPVTGASLPFFSSGGTSLLMLLGQMGIMLAISRRIPAPKKG